MASAVALDDHVFMYIMLIAFKNRFQYSTYSLGSDWLWIYIEGCLPRHVLRRDLKIELAQLGQQMWIPRINSTF